MKHIIYKHTNTKTGKSYIGRTSTTLENRFNDHCRRAKNGSTFSFHKALIEFDSSNFESTILETCDDDNVVEREQYWIEFFDSYKSGYNMNGGGAGYGNLSEHSKNKFKNSMNVIQENGKTKAQNAYIKRNETLSKKDKNFTKTIALKAAKTTKIRGSLKGENNPNFNNSPISLIGCDGNIILKCLLSEIHKLDKEIYPIRMILWSLHNNRPMYTHNQPRNKNYVKFINSIAKYEESINQSK